MIVHNADNIGKITVIEAPEEISVPVHYTSVSELQKSAADWECPRFNFSVPKMPLERDN